MSSAAADIAIRPARPEDVPHLITLIQELAEYERARNDAKATEELLFAALFGPTASAYCHVAERDDQVLGLAVWFLNFSTWLGRPGIYLEDLYVRPEARGSGAGRALLRELAAICVQRGYARLDWAVLDWNEPARKFYERLGAQAMTDWVPYRLTGESLRALAGTGQSSSAAEL